MRRLPVRPPVRRRNPAYDEDAYRRALAGDKNLEGANLYEANLSRANLEDADLRSADLKDANLEGANLASADLTGANLRGANLLGANLVRAYLEDANLEDANLLGANLLGANLKDANLEGANLEGARLVEAKIAYARLVKVNLTRANLIGSNLEEANLAGVTLKDADFTGAKLAGAKLAGANLEGANFADVEWDAETTWPAGFVPPPLTLFTGEHLTLSDPTGSEAFRRWFGDSVVKDETGRPVVVYHGTRRGGFTSFDPMKADAHHPGFYFTNDIVTANTYVGRKTTLPDPVTGKTGAGAYRLYIKMERPFIHDAEGAQWNKLRVPEFPKSRKTYEVAQAVKDTGRYDGVILKNLRDSGEKTPYDEPADVYVVFDPKNIKSATANVGTYDPNDPDIRHNPRCSFNPRSFRGARSTRNPKGRR